MVICAARLSSVDSDEDNLEYCFPPGKVIGWPRSTLSLIPVDNLFLLLYGILDLLVVAYGSHSIVPVGARGTTSCISSSI